jgi:hypothetical protein
MMSRVVCTDFKTGYKLAKGSHVCLLWGKNMRKISDQRRKIKTK